MKQNKNSVKEESITTVVDEPVVEKTPTQPNNELFTGYKLIEVDGGDEAIITYPNTETQIPLSYQYTYTLMGNEIVDTFDNVSLLN